MMEEDIYQIRQFNRHYTSILGLLNKHHLNSEFSLPEGRVLFELFHKKELTASDIVDALQIDKSYLSRVLKKFEKEGLISRTASNSDSRFSWLNLTPSGVKAYEKLNALSDQQIMSIFGTFSQADTKKVIAGMYSIQEVLSRHTPPKQSESLKISIVNTGMKDIDKIYALYDEAIAYQQRRGFPVWNGYDKRVLNAEILNKSQYKIMIGNEIACFFSACQPGPVETELWEKRVQERSIYLHRIVTNQAYKGHKLFAKILEWIAAYTAGKNYRFIRMDTWADNPPLINYYKSFGFTEVGTSFTSDSEDLPTQYRKVKIVKMEKSIVETS